MVIGVLPYIPKHIGLGKGVGMGVYGRGCHTRIWPPFEVPFKKRLENFLVT